MSNMSYCRFENTYHDLCDCEDHFDDDEISESEEMYRKHLLELCRKIVEQYGD